ncbi:MAG: DnaJ domain-containing protein, partial [Bacilli bacterium]|nr:DnaJ domain-containing protein [Bacilli bacterium]
MDWWEKKENWLDCFEVLGVKENATEQEIKRAYRALAKKYHPEGKDENVKKFEEAKLAYDTLMDEKKREKYTAFWKRLKELEHQAKKEEKQEEKTLSFEDLVQIYKENELKIKLTIKDMIRKEETKAEKFFSIYDNLFEAIREKKISEKDFEIRRQKLYSLSLANINSIKELEEQIEDNLSNMPLDYEKKRLQELKAKFKETESILTSSYSGAIAKLVVSEAVNKAKEKNTLKSLFKSSYITFATVSIFLTIIGLIAFYNSKLPKEEEEIVAEVDDQEPENVPEDRNSLILDSMPTKEESEEIITPNSETEDETYEDCILFESVPDDMEYDEISPYPYHMGPYEVVGAEKDGVGYILDSEDHHVIIANYLSHGPAFYDYETNEYVYCFLSIDGYDYYLDAFDLRTIIKVKSAYS